MTCISHMSWINLESIILELTCCKSCIPWAPSLQFTRSQASRHDETMSSLLYPAICLKNVNIVPSCPLFVILFTVQSDKWTCCWQQHQTRDMSSTIKVCIDWLCEWWTSESRSAREACHARRTFMDFFLFSFFFVLKVHQSFVVYVCVRMFLPHLGVRTQHPLLWFPPLRL